MLQLERGRRDLGGRDRQKATNARESGLDTNLSKEARSGRQYCMYGNSSIFYLTWSRIVC